MQHLYLKQRHYKLRQQQWKGKDTTILFAKEFGTHHFVVITRSL